MSRPWTSILSWRLALLPTLSIVVLVTLKGLAAPVYTTALGRLPAMMIEIMASRPLYFGWMPTGYYEQVFWPDQDNWQEHWGTEFVPDAFRVLRMKPNLASVTPEPVTNSPTNRFGYAGPQWTLIKRPDTRRVAILGDSIAQGYGLNSSQNFVNLLADRLNADNSPHRQQLEFLNFAVPGYELTQTMDVALQDAPQFQPDVYVLMLTELSVYRPWDAHLIYLVQSGVDPKYDFLRETVREASAKRSDDESMLSAKFAPYRMSIIRQTILNMKVNAEQHHAQFIVVLTPTVEDADLSNDRFAGIPELLSSMNITFVDLSNTFSGILDRKSIRLNGADIHPNEKGDEMIYEALYEKLRANPDAWSKLVGFAQSPNQQP
jgi:lysophospholipase L1-like esterase